MRMIKSLCWHSYCFGVGMKTDVQWLEVIRIRCPQQMRPRLLDSLARIEAQVGDSEPEMQVFGCTNVADDVAVIAAWRKLVPPKDGSFLSQLIKREIEELGLVDHTVWQAVSLLGA